MKNNSKCSVVITTTDDKKTAETIAALLVKNGLAACVQIDEVRSFFNYEAEISDLKEFRLWIKASADNYEAIEKSIKDHHNYQLPQIIMLEIATGLPQYLDWVRGN